MSSNNNQQSLQGERRINYRLVPLTGSNPNQVRQESSRSERQVTDASDSNNSIRQQVKDQIGKKAGYNGCHTTQSKVYTGNTVETNLRYMENLLQNDDTDTALQIQQFEKNILQIFENFLALPANKNKPKPSCFYELKCRCDLPIREWMKTEIGDLKRRKLLKSSKASKCKQVLVISAQEMAQMDQSQAKKRIVKQSKKKTDQVKIERPNSSVSLEILEQEPADLKRQRLEAQLIDKKCFINEQLMKKLSESVMHQHEFSIAPDKNFALINSIQVHNGNRYIFAGFVPSVNSQAERHKLAECFHVHDYLLGNSQLLVLLFLTKDTQASTAEKDFVLALMLEKEIPLVCFKKRSNNSALIFKKEDFFSISHLNPRQFEPAQNICFDNQLGWHIFVQNGKGFHSSLQIFSESLDMKEIELNQFTSRELCQNRNTYTMNLNEISVASNILEPKHDHDYYTRISQKLLEEFSSNQDTPRFSSDKNQSLNLFHNDESTDISTHNSKTKKSKNQRTQSPSGSSQISQFDRGFNKYQTALSEIGDFEEQFHFGQQRECVSNHSAKFQANQRTHYSPPPVSQFRCQPHNHDHSFMNQLQSPTHHPQQVIYETPTNSKQSSYIRVHSPESMFSNNSIAYPPSHQSSHPMSWTTVDYAADPLHFHELQKFNARSKFQEEKDYIQFNEWMFCQIYYEEPGTKATYIISSRKQGLIVKVGLLNGQPQISVSGRIEASKMKKNPY